MLPAGGSRRGPRPSTAGDKNRPARRRRRRAVFRGVPPPVVMNQDQTTRLKVGGQAVLEGVMMRSPHSLAVAVRRTNGEIVLREAPWRSLWERLRFLRWPFFRGTVVLLESLVNGISALNFSARIAMADEEAAAAQAETVPAGTVEAAGGQEAPAHQVDPSRVKEVSDWVIWGTVVLALGLGVALFVALPHLAVWLGSLVVGRELGVDEIAFHVIVGVVKLGVFLGYISLISLMKDVRQVFMYHGAEHQSIYTYEAGQDLTVANARGHTPLHPRCGTTFLIMVIAVSILVFSLVFPVVIWLVGEPTGIGAVDQMIYIAIKLPLLLPIAGLAYEFQRLTSRFLHRKWARALAWPGMLVQKLTTRPPTDEQLEVALTSLRKTLWREQHGEEDDQPFARGGEVEVFADFEAVRRRIPQAG